MRRLGSYIILNFNFYNTNERRYTDALCTSGNLVTEKGQITERPPILSVVCATPHSYFSRRTHYSGKRRVWGKVTHSYRSSGICFLALQSLARWRLFHPLSFSFTTNTPPVEYVPPIPGKTNISRLWIISHTLQYHCCYYYYYSTTTAIVIYTAMTAVMSTLSFAIFTHAQILFTTSYCGSHTTVCV